MTKSLHQWVSRGSADPCRMHKKKSTLNAPKIRLTVLILHCPSAVVNLWIGSPKIPTLTTNRTWWWLQPIPSISFRVELWDIAITKRSPLSPNSSSNAYPMHIPFTAFSIRLTVQCATFPVQHPPALWILITAIWPVIWSTQQYNQYSLVNVTLGEVLKRGRYISHFTNVAV